MKVKLVSLTRPADSDMTAEELIAYVARVSSPDNQDNHNTAPKLLSYCMKNGHWSVFETANMTLEIETDLATATQILRHKSMSFQVFSMRYAKSNIGFEDITARAPHPKNRQLSVDNLSEETKQEFNELLDKVQKTSRANYEQALHIGVAKEVARFLLPQCTLTRMYATANVRSWITYFMQRLHPSSQLEHRRVAKAAYKIFADNFPVCAEVLQENHPDLEYQ